MENCYPELPVKFMLKKQQLNVNVPVISKKHIFSEYSDTRRKRYL